MAVGSAVYQPTTVTYEQSSGGGGGGGGGVGGGEGWRRRWCWGRDAAGRAHHLARAAALPLLAAAALLALLFGIKLIIDGSLSSATASLIIGVLLLIVGLGLAGLVIRIMVRRHSGWSDGNKGVEAGGGITGATLGAPNPSTDPLVASQYAPVRDAPPADDERRQLMDNKECLSSAEESDRMLESDPRIVLRPSKNVEDA
ncbi:uncharacterized protein LOC143912555 [Arctopsyche grandis]|uniref:uncharacterized protein LOC143912555 n=1 Tax=Arctopsyche grandis TaxID=121162 RepID=UPI00406D79E2